MVKLQMAAPIYCFHWTYRTTAKRDKIYELHTPSYTCFLSILVYSCCLLNYCFKDPKISVARASRWAAAAAVARLPGRRRPLASESFWPLFDPFFDPFFGPVFWTSFGPILRKQMSKTVDSIQISMSSKTGDGVADSSLFSCSEGDCATRPGRVETDRFVSTESMRRSSTRKHSTGLPAIGQLWKVLITWH